jgi:raffinose/stachyose/melibiose transport system permease protein
LKAVGLGSLFAPWLGLPSTALVTLALISVWQFVGTPLMLIYASLLNIPDELVDAARVGGLGHLRISCTSSCRSFSRPSASCRF